MVKYTKKYYWVAVARREPRDIFYTIFPHGAGFNLFIVANYRKNKICHVKRFESAKQIANLIENG